MARIPVRKGNGSATLASTKRKKLKRSNIPRASKEEIEERRKQVARLRMRGLGYRAIGKLLSVGHMTIKRDLEAIRENNKEKVTTLDRSEHVGESLSVFEEVELRAWQDYHTAQAGSQQRQKFLAEVQEARKNQTRLLTDLGVVSRAPLESVIKVSAEVIQGWSSSAQDLVALAILKSQLKPLAEPREDKMLEEDNIIDVQETISSTG